MNEVSPKKCYLSGPMTGYPENNYPAFEKATAALRQAGYHVFTPHEYMPPKKPTISELRRAFAAYSRFICEEADTIILLSGWEQSLGVSAELALAKNCGLEIVEFDTFISPATP